MGPAAALPLLLVFEDDADAGLILETYLGERGFRVLVAGDGTEAAALVAAHRPALVLMDVGMPGKGGLEACREIRAAGSDVPIVVLSAHAFPEDVARGLAAGANAYLTKRIDPAEVEAAVRRLLSGKPAC